MTKKSLYIVLLLALFSAACSTTKPVVVKKRPATPVAEKPVQEKEVVTPPKPVPASPKPEAVVDPVKEITASPYVMREFRAAWIATVANINWPSKAGLSSEAQQKEALQLLDFLQQHNYNAVIFQVRPQADALYKSNLEPWSYFLTGEPGKAPEPYYDPLEFWIKAAHDRGLELHVWLNPYRAHHTTGGEVKPASVVKQHPELVVQLRNGMWWMDPSKEAVQDHTAAVVMDLVKRYNLDGVHFDDYFYPYASYNKGADFPDAASYAAYTAKGGKLSKEDWRRESVNRFVERIYKEIKAEKPEVKFGISPFGIYRPGHPQSISGMDQYSELYADAKLWLNKGWIDYYSPQLYWKISQTAQSFPVLLGWWEKENLENRHLWPGINIDFGGDDPNLIETVSQIMITRGMLPESKGSIHWSIGPLLKYPKLSAGILDNAYRKQALVPESPWLNDVAPAAPQVSTFKNGEKVLVSWKHEDPKKVFQWVVYYKYNNKWNYKILDHRQRSFTLPKYLADKKENGTLTNLGVTAVSRTGVQSNFLEKQIPADLALLESASEDQETTN
ncbi:glycoside hydrolase family 10 protein [Salinimicrobium soli]|uniref:glycoside hydrolase family 10 protein n=1 Tax=Salinimicrobium soli TaxID=1254399 RepID=UPI003AAD6C46